uniref:Uncharacterized protein n=1 Tax=Anopheles minimus TaxID=112268 RepID=A0A182W9W5_9DIPT
MLPQVLYILQKAGSAISLEEIIARVQQLGEGNWTPKDDRSWPSDVLQALDKGMQFGFIVCDRSRCSYKLGVNYLRVENYHFYNELRVLNGNIALHGLQEALPNMEHRHRSVQSDISDDSSEFGDSVAYESDDELTPTPKKKIKTLKLSKKRVQLSNIERNYRTLQSQYNWKPMSETLEKFGEKFPLQYDDKAGLIHRTERLNYIKSSQPKLAREVRIPLKRYGSSDETCSIAEPADSFRFGQICNKPVDRPKGFIYTNAKGFARLADPYLTTTMKDIVPHVKHQHDTVTFWNWAEREERNQVPKATNTLQPRMVLPLFKRKLNRGFVSEMRANYVKPVEMEFRLDPTVTRPIVLEPTDHTDTATESSMYGGTKNCAMILKQRNYE